jgi:hypothetical protein
LRSATISSSHAPHAASQPDPARVALSRFCQAPTPPHAGSRLRREVARAGQLTSDTPRQSHQEVTMNQTRPDHTQAARQRRHLAIAAMIAIAAGGALAAGPAQAQTAADIAFRDTVQGPPPGYSGPEFKLSHDYPTSVPSQCADCAWLKLNVNFNPTFDRKKLGTNTWVSGKWAEYLQLILNYVKQGQDPQFANAPGFQIGVNGKTRWYSVPWMAYDPTAGREFVHGTTNERTAHLVDLIHPDGGTKGVLRGRNEVVGETVACAKKYPEGFETWAVGYYNEYGGMAVGKAIPASGVPKIGTYLGSPMPEGLPFPQGTVVVKFLTTTATPDCVPFLKGSPEWQLDRHVLDQKQQKYLCQRFVQTSRMVQIDVAVTDSRSPTGWVYGTFAYDGDLPGKTFWDRLEPLGIEFGADPWTFPAVPKTSSLPAQQSVINPHINIYQHLGCENRLAGPVDNRQSSCLGCHGSAYAAPNGALTVMGFNVPPSFGFPGMCQEFSLTNAAYFDNTPAPQSFSGGNYPNAVGLDTSLQLEVALIQYGNFNINKAPNACKLDQAP